MIKLNINELTQLKLHTLIKDNISILFESTCSLWPISIIKGTIISYEYIKDELVFKVKLEDKDKLMTIGANTPNLSLTF